jgi:hypothetical protein
MEIDGLTTVTIIEVFIVRDRPLNVTVRGKVQNGLDG